MRSSILFSVLTTLTTIMIYTSAAPVDDPASSAKAQTITGMINGTTTTYTANLPDATYTGIPDMGKQLGIEKKPAKRFMQDHERRHGPHGDGPGGGRENGDPTIQDDAVQTAEVTGHTNPGGPPVKSLPFLGGKELTSGVARPTDH